MRTQSRYHATDGWRGYSIPGNAIAGSSDTGMYDDSPAPSDKVKAEIRRFQREVLRPAGIKSRQRYGRTSNVFNAKRWVVVAQADFAKAAQLAADWLAAHKLDTRFIHDADLDDLGYKAKETS